jgi:DNA primase
MAKHTKQVVIAYDSDEAGQNATKKAIRMLTDVGLEVKVLNMEGAKDPDEYIKKFGKEKFGRLLDVSKSGFDFKLDATLGKYDVSIAEDKIKASSEICSYIAEIYSSVEREVYIAAAAKRLGVTDAVLKNDVDMARKKKIKEYNAQVSRQVRNEAMGIGDKINSDGIKNIRARGAEETIIGLLLIFEEYRSMIASGKIELSPSDFFSSFHASALERILLLESNGEFDFSLLGQYFSPEEMGRLEGLMQKRRELSVNGVEVLLQCIETLKKEKNLSNGEDSISDILRVLETKRGKNQKQ